MLKAEQLTKIFNPGTRRAVTAVHDASFTVEAGEIFGLLGPNGAGKTTLLRMLGTIISPSSGTVWVDGVNAAEARAEIRRNIGFLSGNTKLYGRLTAAELLRYFGRIYDMSEDAITARTEQLSTLLGMDEFLDRRCEALSTGQTQKVSIARVLLHDPKVLILDEPTLGLDIMSSRTILEFIRDAKARGRAIIFSTHYMTEAEQLCDRIGLIHESEMLALGTQAELHVLTGTANLQDAFLALVEKREVAAS